MYQRWSGIALGMMLAATAVLAQTTVTTSGGTANTVPMFTGSATVGNSAITQSAGSVGIGTTNPRSTLDVNGNINYSTLTAGLGVNGNGNPSGYYFVGSLPNVGTSVIQHLEIEALGGSWTSQGLTRWTCNGYGGSIRCTRLNDSYSPDMNDLTAFLDSSGNFDFYVSANAGNGWDSFSVSAKLWDGTYYRTVNPIYTASPSGTQQTIALTIGPTLTQGGNVGIGTTAPGAKLEVDGNVKLTSGSGASITFADGSVQSTAYTGVTCGGDYAESVDVTGDRTSYEPGDVIVIDPDSPGRFFKSNQPYSTTVTGVYSTKPGVVGRRQTTDPKTSTTEIPMAMVGIVPTKVSAENGAIQPGDLLVSSSIIGYAMKGTDRSRMLGAVMGKALGRLDSGSGVIEAAITLQ